MSANSVLNLIISVSRSASLQPVFQSYIFLSKRPQIDRRLSGFMLVWRFCVVYLLFGWSWIRLSRDPKLQNGGMCSTPVDWAIAEVSRVIVFGSLYAFCYIPIAHAYLADDVDTTEYPILSLLSEGAMHIAGAFFYVTRIPERYFPGRFDIFVSCFLKFPVKLCANMTGNREQAIRFFIFSSLQAWSYVS